MDASFLSLSKLYDNRVLAVYKIMADTGLILD